MIHDKKIQNQEGLVKRGSAVVNINDDEYKNALARLKRENEAHNLIEKTNILEKKVESLDEKLNQILALLMGK